VVFGTSFHHWIIVRMGLKEDPDLILMDFERSDW
jgi:hypothetical protein